MRKGTKRPRRTAVTPQDVLEFWFAPESKKRWFESTDTFDAEISRRFEGTGKILADPIAVTGIDWRADPSSQLAEIIVLDQFPRNIYRGTPDAFAWDSQARVAANSLVDKGWDMELAKDRRSFAYMPFMHAEDLAAQNRCVELVGSRLQGDESTLRHAKLHRDVIERFGRFPHRNAVLGRDSTPAEIAFLQNGGYNPS